MDVNKEVQDIVQSGDKRFSYMMLSRLQSDCNYYLGNGGGHKKHLWAGDEQDHIDVMKGIWNSFADNKKPEWLTWEELLDFERKMVK